MRTSRIRLGTLLTPLSIMRPWKLAGEVATLDQLSNGRTILTVGMGAPDVGFAAFGEATDLPTRAELVDEGLDLLDALWSHKPFVHHGKHYQVDARRLRAPVPIPPLVQQPRVPIWVVGAWPRPKSMRRVLRCDGILPWIKPKGTRGRSPTPDDIGEIDEWVAARRKVTSPFDIVIEGVLPDDPDEAAAMTMAFAGAGATWWIESLWGKPWDVWERSLHRGPPK
jgi:alkanesulfonate monooxygenase SsuD/methylene tetrahydromethanopterin reductase-like flavin-dependent oxidoreductase (luciferase family)